MDQDALRRDLKALMERARAAFASWVTAEGRPLTTAAERVSVDASLRGFKAEVVHVEENASWRYLGEWRMPVDWTRAALGWAHQAAEECASTLPFSERAYASFAATLVGWEPTRFSYAENSARWLVENAAVPATVHYIKSLRTAAVPDDELLVLLADEVVERLSGGQQRLRTTVAVAGIQTKSEIAAGGLTVRPMTPFERGDLLRQTTGQQPTALPPLASAYLKGDLPTHLLYADESFDNSVEHPEASSVSPQTLLAAFALHGFFLAGVGAAATEFLPKWAISGLGSGPLPMAPWAFDPLPMKAAVLAEVAKTLEALRGYSLEQPRTPRDLALHRFALGCSRTEPVDGLLDHVIALEALLLPYDAETKRGDLSYRFRLHGAHWIGDRHGDREAVWKQLTELYGVRSSIVHGNKFPAKRDVQAQARSASALAAAGLLRAVREGFPEPVLFRRAVLGSV